MTLKRLGLYLAVLSTAFLVAFEPKPNECGLSQADFDKAESEVTVYLNSFGGEYPPEQLLEDFLVNLTPTSGAPERGAKRQAIRELVPKLKASANKRLSRVSYLPRDEFHRVYEEPYDPEDETLGFANEKGIFVNTDAAVSTDDIRGTLIHEYLHIAAMDYSKELGREDGTAEMDHNAIDEVCDNMSAAQYNSVFAGTGFCFDDLRHEFVCSPNLDSGLRVTHTGDVHAAIPLPGISVRKPEDEQAVAASRRMFDDCGFEHVLDISAATSRKFGDLPSINIQLEADEGEVKTISCGVNTVGPDLAVAQREISVFMKATKWFAYNREVDVKIRLLQEDKQQDLFLMTSVTWDFRMTNDPEVLSGAKAPTCTDSDDFEKELEWRKQMFERLGGTCVVK